MSWSQAVKGWNCVEAHSAAQSQSVVLTANAPKDNDLQPVSSPLLQKICPRRLRYRQNRKARRAQHAQYDASVLQEIVTNSGPIDASTEALEASLILAPTSTITESTTISKRKRKKKRTRRKSGTPSPPSRNVVNTAVEPALKSSSVFVSITAV